MYIVWNGNRKSYVIYCMSMWHYRSLL